MYWITDRFLKVIYWILFPSLLFLSTISYADTLSVPLTLSEAEHLAIINEPLLEGIEANVDALDQQAIADDQLDDPELMLGVQNLPTNTLSFTQDDMTMITAGVQQTFPKGHSLTFKSQATAATAQAEEMRKMQQTLVVLRTVRDTWLDLYYWTQAAQVIKTNQKLFKQLVKATVSQYSVGKTNQQNVLQAQLALTRLSDQATQVDSNIALLRAQLARWIGSDEANRPLASLPDWLPPPPLATLQHELIQHPLLKIDAATIQSDRDDVCWAKEQYKPGFTVGVGYELRQGDFADGTPRSDMVTAQATVSLPVFPDQRQTRRLNASEDKLVAGELTQQVHYRDLSSKLAAQYAVWQDLSTRVVLYDQHLLPEAKQSAKATMLAYQNNMTDFASVIRAYNTVADMQLEQLRIQVDRDKAQVDLLYLQGM